MSETDESLVQIQVFLLCAQVTCSWVIAWREPGAFWVTMLPVDLVGE